MGDNVGNKDQPPSTGSGDCSYPFDYTALVDEGNNLDSDGSCIAGTSAPNDRTANPMLGPLKLNGGPVPTDALLPGSPAIGHAYAPSCPSTDARGVRRASKCDIGAYQHQPKPKKRHKKK